MLGKKKVKIGEDEYEVREVTISQILPILPKFGTEEQQQAQVELLKACVYKNGELLGDKVDALGIRAFMLLVPAVLEVCGMSGE
jgi:hypothetical protein